jgi:murein DD-endopeptidase MepM/ murein hydrolase activator NlpD
MRPPTLPLRLARAYLPLVNTVDPVARRTRLLRAAPAITAARTTLRAPVHEVTALVSIAATLVLAGVWAWPVDDAPLTLAVPVSAARAAPPPAPVDPTVVEFTPDGLLAGIVMLDNGPAMPVLGVRPSDLRDTYGQPRGNDRRHGGIDIAAARRTPIAAVMDGWVALISNRAVGGLGLHVVDRSGTWLLYYAHLDGFAEGIYAGQAVRRGELLGYVGATGNADGFSHLHFEVGRLIAPGQLAAAPVNPYDFLMGRLTQ